MRRNVFIAVIAILVLGVAACGGPGEQAGNANQTSACNTDPRPLANVETTQRNNYYANPPEQMVDSSQTYVATIQTSRGDIKLLLDAADTPQTVNNFVFLSCQGFYDPRR
jgi:hypothetical protein